MLTVVKVGGRAAATEAGLRTLARGIAGRPGPTMVVHGGGSDVSAWQDRLGLEVRWRNGLRVTTPEGMQVTSMVLSGWTNKRIVAALVEAGETAVGLSGEDGPTLRAAYHCREELGEVGRVERVDPTVLRSLLAGGFLPVVSPVSAGPGGRPLNVNADEAAVALAVALSAGDLLLVSDVEGVGVGGGVLPRLTGSRAAALVEDGTVSGGMAVKVTQACEAVRAGVRVRIGDAALLTDPRAGTVLEETAPLAAVG